MSNKQNKGSILVIDDEIYKNYTANYKTTLNNIIFSIGYSPEFADNGSNGVKEINDDLIGKQIKLVILDNEFKKQKLQGGDILKQIRSIREDLPIVILSKLPKDDFKRKFNYDKDILPASKSAKKLGAVAYIEKNEFLERPETVKNHILSIIEKPKFNLVLDCKTKELDFIDSEGKKLTKINFSKKEISQNWRTRRWPLSKEHFLFKLLYKVAKETSKEIELDKVFNILKIKRGKMDAGDTINPDDSYLDGLANKKNVPKGAAFSVAFKQNYESLVEELEGAEIKGLGSEWFNLVKKFTGNPVVIYDLEEILEEYLKNNKNNQDLLRWKKNLLKNVQQFKRDLENNAPFLVPSKIVNEFNEKVKKKTNGRIVKLLEGSGGGSAKGEACNTYKLNECVIKAVPINDADTELPTESPNDMSRNEEFLTYKRLNEELEFFKKEILTDIDNRLMIFKKDIMNEVDKKLPNQKGKKS